LHIALFLVYFLIKENMAGGGADFDIMTEQHPILDKVPTTLSFGRLGFGVLQGVDLLLTPPEERTGGDAIKTAVAAGTDKLDGAWTGWFGSTEHGPLIDRLADITFSVLGEGALAINGEISPIHPLISIGREATVHAMRWSATKNGQPPIAVGNRGREKTTAKMAMLTFARSQFAGHSDVLESMASFGSALSLISGGEYAQQWFAGRHGGSDRSDASSARNGAARRVSASPNAWVVDRIHKKLPFVTPDHLTLLGEGLVEASLIAAYLKPKWGFALAIGPYTLGGIVDGWDGNLARLKGITGLKGMLKDVRADKRQEIATAITNSLLASKHDNSVAASQYAVGAMTAALPAFFRAAAEAKGYIVNEDASGSRLARGIEGGVGLGFNDNPGISNTISALMVAGNVITSAQRADVVMHGTDSPHCRGTNNNRKFRAEAAARRDALLPIALAGMAIGSGLLVKERIRVTRAKPDPEVSNDEAVEQVPATLPQ
jgi:phosphatidylglycerophosphate synthase